MLAPYQIYCIYSERQEFVRGEQQVMNISACTHPEAAGERWGDPISKERQQYLLQFVDSWPRNPAIGDDIGPF